MVWHPEDVLEIHPHDAEERGVRDGDLVRLASRVRRDDAAREITDRVAPGVVYTTFHHPATQANVVTSDYSDWATNCPEYKVTAVQVTPSNGPSEWQEEYRELTQQQPPHRGRAGEVMRGQNMSAPVRSVVRTACRRAIGAMATRRARDSGRDAGRDHLQPQRLCGDAGDAGRSGRLRRSASA